MRLLKPAAALCLLAANACTSDACPSADQTTRTIDVAGSPLQVEIADTPSERACGLSRREHIGADNGMLFVYSDDQVREFWMKDTWIPLSIAFVDAQGRITELVDMDPARPEVRIRSRVPVRFALETRRGWFQENGVRPGDIVTLGMD